MKKKEPAQPRERDETVRREITALLHDGLSTAKELSGLVSVSEKEVYAHLKHIQRSFHNVGGGVEEGKRFKVMPATCRHCGFVFKKRERLKKPGRCPRCKGEAIEEPAFEVS